jgi:serine/threonine protein kinase
VADAERRRRFVQEAKAASALNHPNIVTIYDIDETEGTCFIAMEYVPGQTLDREIGRKGLPLADALGYAVQIADALARAHQTVVHRDLKPANIIVTGSGSVKILDFGLAKLMELGRGKTLPRSLRATSRKRAGSWAPCRTCRRSKRRASRWMRARISSRSAPCYLKC